MRPRFLGILWLLGTMCAPPLFAFASVTINEILFDPSGTDTGLEKIEIYNPDAAAADMGGWELYPDSFGYFSFPSGFSLVAQSFVMIHLRTSGANDVANLYHAGATANMGNSSGSVALFRSGGRTKDTIVDFMRYHKPGSSERKTWESTAAEAGFWTTGAYVDVASLSEGNSVGLVADGVRGSAASWQIYASPSIGSANGAVVGSSPAPPAAEQTPPVAELPAAPPPPPASADAAPVPSLGADAGPNAVAIAGAIVQFNGVAFGLDGKVLDGARFLWNFGDGSTEEKQSPTHIYHFPGTYDANLSVQSGHYAGSDWRTVTVLPAELALSEVKPGEDGFIEIANASAVRVDLGGMFLTDDRKVVFRIPAGTVVGARGTVVLPAINTHLAPTTYLDLRDARGVTLDAARFTDMLPAGASWERSGYAFVVRQSPTPGRVASKIAAAPTPSRASPSPPPSLEPRLPDGQVPRGEPPAAVSALGRKATPPSPTPFAMAGSFAPPARVPLQVAAAAGALPARLFFAASIILGLITAAGIVVLKRMGS